ncbi:hypothetical protein DENSPDRAFT_838481 [Dentipellis sp. KUC8613]|nr:hypothetical protein DENSPDRAFT_838481 [Dentipellis sp. KUC8613]
MTSQAQAEGVCLKFPENLPLHPTFSHENAVAMLLRAIQLSTQVPYNWGYIDKPADGQLFLIFVPQRMSLPVDGIHFQEQEQRYVIPAGQNRELEVVEARHGFIPNSGETTASRVRRRFRMLKGGHPQLILIHYSRGSALPIPPALLNLPGRPYPLPPINELSVYVMGDKMGQKVVQGGPPVPPGMPHQMQPGPQNINFGGRDPQALLAQQNREMEALERRSQRERSASMSQRIQQLPPQRIDEEDSADELEQISTRTLAAARYKRNHEFMNEVFMHAAFGDKHAPKPPPAYSIFNKSELEEKLAKLTSEIETLRADAAARQATREEAEKADVSMEALGGDVSIAIDPAIESLDMPA